MEIDRAEFRQIDDSKKRFLETDLLRWKETNFQSSLHPVVELRKGRSEDTKNFFSRVYYNCLKKSGIWKNFQFSKLASRNWPQVNILFFEFAFRRGTIRSRITGAFSIHRKSDIIDPDRGTGSPRKSLGISFFYSDCCISRLCVDEKKRNKKPRPSMSFLIH